MWFADKEKQRVVSRPELLAIVALFAFVFYFLFPDKEKLYHQLLMSENSNYDLTAAYLKNIASLEKENEKYLYRLAKVLIGQGKFDLADVTIKTLEEGDNDDETKLKAMLLRYELYKREYYATDKEALRRRFLRQMSQLLNTLASRGHLERLSDEELEGLDDLKQPLLAEKRLHMKLLKGPKDKKTAMRLHTLAVRLNDTDMIAWSENYLAKHFHDDVKMVDKKMLEKDLSTMAAVYLKKHQIKDVVSLWIQAYRKMGETGYLFKAIETYMGAGQYRKAVALTKKYEKVLLQKRSDAEKVIDIYLQSNAVAEARRVSEKVMERIERAPHR